MQLILGVTDKCIYLVPLMSLYMLIGLNINILYETESAIINYVASLYIGKV